MSAEENKALYRQWIEEVFNKRQTDRIGDFVASDIVEHTPNFQSGLEGARQGVGVFLTAFPDLRVTVEEVVAEGDRLVARLSASGTQKGSFQGIPPTGREMTVAGMDMWRVAGGKCAEHWLEMDSLGMLQQLGVIPQPEQARG